MVQAIYEKQTEALKNRFGESVDELDENRECYYYYCSRHGGVV